MVERCPDKTEVEGPIPSWRTCICCPHEAYNARHELSRNRRQEALGFGDDEYLARASEDGSRESRSRERRGSAKQTAVGCDRLMR